MGADGSKKCSRVGKYAGAGAGTLGGRSNGLSAAGASVAAGIIDTLARSWGFAPRAGGPGEGAPESPPGAEGYAVAADDDPEGGETAMPAKPAVAIAVTARSSA